MNVTGSSGIGPGLLDVARNVTAAYRQSLVPALRSRCVVDVAKLNLGPTAFEASCPGFDALNLPTPDYDFCGGECGCELGRQLVLAGYPVIGPHAVATEVRKGDSKLD